MPGLGAVKRITFLSKGTGFSCCHGAVASKVAASISWFSLAIPALLTKLQ
jgi:hypothetical protein